MRQREKSYRDYGISKDETEEVKAFCKDANNAQIVAECAVIANKDLCGFLILSMRYRYSYETLTNSMDMYCSKVDFYAYRRRAYAEVAEKMKGLPREEEKKEPVKKKSRLLGQLVFKLNGEIEK